MDNRDQAAIFLVSVGSGEESLFVGSKEKVRKESRCVGLVGRGGVEGRVCIRERRERRVGALWDAERCGLTSRAAPLPNGILE